LILMTFSFQLLYTQWWSIQNFTIYAIYIKDPENVHIIALYFFLRDSPS
jgi:hypothetical protein